MKLTIITPDNLIIKDGIGQQMNTVDTSYIPDDVWAVQWDSEKGEGIIEYKPEAEKGNDKITSLGVYSQAIQDWETEKTVIDNAIEAARDHAEEVRNRRTGLLTNSDWTRVDDNGLSASKKTEWATYRQALRDVPSTIVSSGISFKEVADDPNHSIWPTEPS